MAVQQRAQGGFSSRGVLDPHGGGPCDHDWSVPTDAATLQHRVVPVPDQSRYGPPRKRDRVDDAIAAAASFVGAKPNIVHRHWLWCTITGAEPAGAAPSARDELAMVKLVLERARRELDETAA